MFKECLVQRIEVIAGEQERRRYTAEGKCRFLQIYILKMFRKLWRIRGAKERAINDKQAKATPDIILVFLLSPVAGCAEAVHRWASDGPAQWYWWRGFHLSANWVWGRVYRNIRDGTVIWYIEVKLIYPSSSCKNSITHLCNKLNNSHNIDSMQKDWVYLVCTQHYNISPEKFFDERIKWI